MRSAVASRPPLPALKQGVPLHQGAPLEPDFAPSSAGQIPFLLRATAFGIFFFPSNMILSAAGAAGTLPMMLSLLLFIFWFCSVTFGLNDPFKVQHPGRVALGLLWLGTCASYVALYLGMTGGSTVTTRAAADRWVLLLIASAGIIFVTAEAVRSLTDALILVRALLLGGLFCCLVAVIQFTLRINPMEWVQTAMPGFKDNGGATPFQDRGALVRVAGSTFHSIELAVVAAMLLPLSIWRAIYDRKGRKWLHWVGTGLLVFAIASTVSRSGVLGFLVVLIVAVPFLPSFARRWAFIVVPLVVSGLFLGVPGLMGTLTGTFTGADSDPSITTRTNNYPRVAAMVADHPFLGLGPGNYVPDTAIHILDNQYLGSAVTLGTVGLLGMIAYLLIPGLATLQAARVAQSRPLKSLAGAVAASGLVAAVCSFTFDSMSFPVFGLFYPFVIGLGGAVWVMVKREVGLLGQEERGTQLRRSPT